MGNRMKVEPLSLREIGLIPLMGVAIFGLTLLAEKTTLSTGEMAVWPADAITLACMLGPMRRRPLLALIVCRCADQVLSSFVGFPLLDGLAINSESIAGIVLLYLLLKKIDHRKMYGSINLLFLFVISFIVCAATALIQAWTLNLSFHINLKAVIYSCFSANFIAYIVLVPLILIIDDELSKKNILVGNILRNVFSIIIYAVCSYFIAKSSLPILFLVPLGLMALAYTASLGAVACAVLITGLFALIATLSGQGAIAETHGTPSTHLLMLQFFLAIITMSILPMAARMSEHKQLREGLISARLEAEAANNAKSQFLATISHEIRTPLNGVLGMAQIMGLSELDPVQKGRLNIIRRSGEVLLSILNDVLDLSKIEAGKLTIETIDFNLGEVLRATTHAYGPLAAEKGLIFSQDLDTIDGVYRGDPTRVRQILTNLISNALKFTEVGEIQVSAHFAAETLYLSVKDTGIGIPPEKLSKLFGKFTQADETTTRRFGGTGLGLSICRDLAGLMGGKIDVESQEGKGSTFTASIPLVRIGDVEPAESEDAELPEAFGAGVRVLAAEDNQTNQLVLRTLLEMVGYEVSIAGDGAEAVSLWEAEDWDVILMDVQMPVMDGPTATRAIRGREAVTGRRRTPIIALTANTMAHQVEGYRADGMDGHVAKPIDAESLFQAIIDATSTVATSKAEKSCDAA
jgi:signal transduction histidine kinase/ActR/RegA family two-component response regulator